MDRLLSAGTDPGTNIVSALAELGLRFIAQQALEQEQEDHLGRGRYERREEHQLGWRNGYEDARLSTAEGAVAVRVPQVRGGEQPYRPKLMEFLSCHSDVLERLVVEMYARGLSTRDVEDCLRDPPGSC
jgi:transposase-like protein